MIPFAKALRRLFILYMCILISRVRIVPHECVKYYWMIPIGKRPCWHRAPTLEIVNTQDLLVDIIAAALASTVEHIYDGPWGNNGRFNYLKSIWNDLVFLFFVVDVKNFFLTFAANIYNFGMSLFHYEYTSAGQFHRDWTHIVSSMVLTAAVLCEVLMQVGKSIAIMIRSTEDNIRRRRALMGMPDVGFVFEEAPPAEGQDLVQRNAQAG